MSFYYDNQTRERAESLMEQQHYPVLEEAASEDEDEYCSECTEPLNTDGDCTNADCENCPWYEDEEEYI